MATYSLAMFTRHGYLRSTCEQIEMKDKSQFVQISDYRMMSPEDRANNKLPVVIENADWYARDAHDGNVAILSFNNKKLRLARWQEDSGVVKIFNVTDKGFQLYDQIKTAFKPKAERGTIMANNDWASDFEASVNAGATPEVNAFTTGTPADGSEKPSYGDIKKARLGDVNFDNLALSTFAQRRGSILFYVVAKDAALKVSARKEAKKANGKYVLTDNVTPERREAIEKGEKAPNAQECVREYVVKMVEGKPTKPSEIVFAIPEAIADYGMAEIYERNGKIDIPADSNTIVKKVMSYEDAIEYIMFVFGGKIQENQTTIGKQASTIEVEARMKKAKDSDEIKISRNLKLSRNANRKALITRGTYIPKKVYKTVKLQNLSKEDSDMLNAAFSGLISKKAGTNATTTIWDELSSQAKDIVKENATGDGYTFSFFEPGVANLNLDVRAFDNPDETLSVLEIPVREKKVAKNGKTSWSYVTKSCEDPDGPLSMVQFRELLDKAKISEENFKKAVAKKTTTSKKNDYSLTAAEYLRAKYAKTSGFSFAKPKSLADVNAAIADAAIL